MCTLIGLWIIPLGISIKSQFHRFIVLWVIFSILTAFVMRRAMAKPVLGTTPRLVYKYFYFIYKLSYGLGIVGYIIMMCTFFGLNYVFNQQPPAWMDVGLLFVFYGLYYGVLGRDLSEICSDKMACNIGVSALQRGLLCHDGTILISVLIRVSVLLPPRNANAASREERVLCVR